MERCDRGELTYLAQPDNRNLNVLYNTVYLPATVGGRWRGWGGPGGGGGAGDGGRGGGGYMVDWTLGCGLMECRL